MSRNPYEFTDKQRELLVSSRARLMEVMGQNPTDLGKVEVYLKITQIAQDIEELLGY